MARVLVTARSFRQTPGEHWHVLEEAECEILTPSQDRPLKAAEMQAMVGDVDAILVGVDEVTASVIQAAPRLRVISKHGTGVDNIDVAEASRKGIAVTNTPGANCEAVAELTVALLLALIRRIPHHDQGLRAGSWSRRAGTELAGKTVGIVGLGRIGKEVAIRLEGFRVHFLANDIVCDEAFAAEHHVEFTSLDDLLTRSDIVTLHTSLTAQTHNLIGQQEFEHMKPTAYILNTARGGLIDEAALCRSLSDGRLAGAALDVFVDEPPTGSALLQLGDKVVLAPHLGSQTVETIGRMATMAAENVVAVLGGRKPAAIVNPEVYQTGDRRLHQG